jgi:hypothetical protein
VDRINYNLLYPKITAIYFNLSFINYKFKNPSSFKGNALWFIFLDPFPY